MISEIIRV